MNSARSTASSGEERYFAFGGAGARRHPLFLTGIGVFALGVAYCVSLLPFVRGDAGTVPLLDVWLNLVFKAGVVVVVALRGWYDRPQRAAWWWLSAGLFAAFLGSFAYYTHYRYLDPVPFPSLVDAGFVGFYLAAYAAIVLMLRERIWPFPRSLLLDALVASCAVGAFAAAFVLDPVLRADEGQAAVVATTLAYAAADLVLVMVLAAAFVLMGTADRTWGLFGLGLLVFFVADGLYVDAAASGSYEAGDPLDIGWTAARLCFVAAALLAVGHVRPVRPATSRLPAPALFSLAAVALLGSYASTNNQLSPTAATLALLAVVLGLSRTVLAFRELRVLAEERERNAVELRRARDEAEAGNRAKTEFVSNISHELRTPLNSVLGFARLLERDLDDPDRERARQIVAAGEHLTETINDLLDLASVERQELRLSLEPVLATDVLRRVIDLTQPLIAERGLALELDAHEGLHVGVLADFTRLQQVLINLVSNAVKYNRPGGTIRLRFERAGDERLRFLVEDTGPGIPAHQLPMVFEPFERLGAENGPEEGTGLGLTVARGMVEAMGGRLQVTSEVGVGSTFSVELRRVDAPRTRSAGAAADHPQLSELAEAEGTVLCIEDHPANVELILDILAPAPRLDVVTADTGAAGLEKARSLEVDLILLDLHLPDTNGFGVLRALRADPATASIPVVVVSADATPDQRARHLTAGADRYIEKPIDPGELIGAVLDGLTSRHRPSEAPNAR